MRALTLSYSPFPDFSPTPSRVDLRVSESRVGLMVSGHQDGGEWYGLTRCSLQNSLRCVACFVAVCSALLLSDTLIVSYCALMILCSR